MNSATNISDVANYFLSKLDITNKKLQKLLYYSYAWFIVENNSCEDDIKKILFKEQPEAWIHGPVFPTIYDKYKGFGWNFIPKFTKKVEIDSEIETFLNTVLDVFGKYNGDQLELMTHNEEPWINARENLDKQMSSNNVILAKDIYKFYSNL